MITTYIRALIVAPLMFLMACEDQNVKDASQGQEEKLPTVALIMKSLANEFFVTMAEGAKQHQLENQDTYNLIVNGIKNESDLAQQVALIDQMIAANVDAIVIAPADSKAIVPALARAESAGIKVINIDNRLEQEVLDDFNLNVPFVGPDNKVGAKKVGDYLAKVMKSGQQVAILEGIPTAYNSQQRRAGFEEAANEAGLDIVTTQSASWDQTKAAEIASAILIQFPELKAFMCANDNMALGAVSAIEQSGRGGDVYVVGFDNISAVRPLVQEGRILATADQYADQLAIFGIEQALMDSDTREDVVTPVDLVTQVSLQGE